MLVLRNSTDDIYNYTLPGGTYHLENATTEYFTAKI